MQPSLVNATLRKRSEREVLSNMVEVKHEGVESKTWNVTAAADSTTNTSGTVSYPGSHVSQAVYYSDQTYGDSWNNQDESTGLAMVKKGTDEQLKLMRSIIMQVFSKEKMLASDPLNPGFSTPSSSEQDTYTIPVSYLSLNTIASLNHGELVYIDMLVRKQEEMIAMVKEKFWDSTHDAEENTGNEFNKLKDAVRSVSAERRRIASTQSSCCFVWALLTSAVSEHARGFTMRSYNTLTSPWLPEYTTDQAVKTIQEAGQIIGQDKRLEALYLSTILQGYEDTTPVDDLANYVTAGEESGLTCEHTLNLLYRYLKLTQGVEGADFVFVRLRDIVHQLYRAQQSIFG